MYTIERMSSALREIRHPATSDLDLATILRTVGDPLRLAMVRLLREAGVTRSRPAGTERYIKLRREDLEGRFPGLVDVLVTPPQA